MKHPLWNSREIPGMPGHWAKWPGPQGRSRKPRVPLWAERLVRSAINNGRTLLKSQIRDQSPKLQKLAFTLSPLTQSRITCMLHIHLPAAQICHTPLATLFHPTQHESRSFHPPRILLDPSQELLSGHRCFACGSVSGHLSFSFCSRASESFSLSPLPQPLCSVYAFFPINFPIFHSFPS